MIQTLNGTVSAKFSYMENSDNSQDTQNTPEPAFTNWSMPPHRIAGNRAIIESQEKDLSSEKPIPSQDSQSKSVDSKP
jgi:hypothetical protein